MGALCASPLPDHVAELDLLPDHAAEAAPVPDHAAETVLLPVHAAEAAPLRVHHAAEAALLRVHAAEDDEAHGEEGNSLVKPPVVPQIQDDETECSRDGFERQRSAMPWWLEPMELHDDSALASEVVDVPFPMFERVGTLPFTIMESSSLTLDNLVDLIKGRRMKNIVVLSGAGVSTAAGIPDFRSKGGFYDKLRPEDLTLTPEQRQNLAGGGDAMSQAVHVDLWNQTQLPLLESHRELIIGTLRQTWKPTLAHWFFAFLEEDGLLRRLYTQNVDGLEHRVGIPIEKIVNVHGTMAKAFCSKCKRDVDIDAFGRDVEAQIKDVWGATAGPPTSTPIPCVACGAARVRPAITLFGESLPARFRSLSPEDIKAADLLIVTGTSLKVAPASKLPGQVRKSCPRLVVNRQVPSGFNTSVQAAKRLVQSLSPSKLYTLTDQLTNPDVLLMGDTDACFMEIMLRLGWHGRLRKALAIGNFAPQSREYAHSRMRQN